MNKRILGEISDIKPEYKDCTILYITLEQYRNDSSYIHNPSFWLEYNGVLYYSICSYDMKFLETFDDWIVGAKGYFNPYVPSEDEYTKLMSMEPTFYKVEFDRISMFLDEFCEYEHELIEPYKIKRERDNKLDNIL